PDLETLPRRDVTGHTTQDHDRVTDDLRVHDRALSDRQRVLRGDLTLDLALDADGPFERELPNHAASLPQERIAPTADVLGHGSTPLPIPRSDVADTRPAGRADGGRQQRTPIVSLSILPEYGHRLLRAFFEPEHSARAPAAGPRGLLAPPRARCQNARSVMLEPRSRVVRRSSSASEQNSISIVPPRARGWSRTRVPSGRVSSSASARQCGSRPARVAAGASRRALASRSASLFGSFFAVISRANATRASSPSTASTARACPAVSSLFSSWAFTTSGSARRR